MNQIDTKGYIVFKSSNVDEVSPGPKRVLCIGSLYLGEQT